MRTTDFAKHLTAFFTEYLIGERGVSPNTIRSYSESFSLLLNFLDEQANIKADNLRLEHITRKTVLNFLDWLQDTKKSSNATRNQRLAALRSFCTYMQYEDVKRLEQWQEILSIKVKTHEKRSVNYLSIDGIRLLLAQIPINTKKGRRDLALISLLYDSGARVQELIDLTPASLKLEKPCHVTLFGKGRKKRIVPLQDEQVNLLRSYMEENRLDLSGFNQRPLFFNSCGRKLTNSGISYILNNYINHARIQNPEHFTLPYAGQPPVPLFITTEGQEETQAPSTPEYGRDLDGMGLFSPEGPAVDAEEEAFIRAMQRRKKKKKRKGLGM